MCGEYIPLKKFVFRSGELPPRVRRIHNGIDVSWWRTGTTSACAENTCGRTAQGELRRNYLRVCGEYREFINQATEEPELPPRVRRIHTGLGASPPCMGTTSACAENTLWCGQKENHPRNYLRVCGEYTPFIIHTPHPVELPPRVRRIQLWQRGPRINGGTTSACAENTPSCLILPSRQRNYLRVCGEYPK